MTMHKLADLSQPVRSTDPVDEFGLSKFTYIDISAVDRVSKEIVNPQLISTDVAPSRARQHLQVGDVVVSTVRPNLNTVARVTDTYSGAIASTGFCVVRPKPQHLDTNYLFHWLSSETSVSRLVILATGATYPAVSDRIIKSLTHDFPSFAVQQRIAAILDKADSLRRKRRAAINLAENFLQAIFINMFGDPDMNPKHFPMGSIRDFVASATYGTSLKAREEVDRYPILRMNNITYKGGWNLSSLKYVDLDDGTAQKYLAEKGDLLFNRTNSKELVGKTAVYMLDEPMAIAGYLVRVRMNSRGNPHYVAGYLNSVSGKRTLEARAKSIVGMANINAQEMQDIPLMLPPIALQERFAKIVEATQERLQTFEIFRHEADVLYSALTHKFFGTSRELETEAC